MSYFAILTNLFQIDPKNNIEVIKIYNENTKQIVHASLQNHLPNNENFKLSIIKDSVIELKFLNISGNNNNGIIFSTGKRINIINFIPVTIINVSVMMIIINSYNLNIASEKDISKLGDCLFLEKLHNIKKKSDWVICIRRAMQRK